MIEKERENSRYSAFLLLAVGLTSLVALAEDSLTIPLPASIAQVENLGSRQDDKTTFRASMAFSTRPQLEFSDSVLRKKTFEAAAVPSLSLALAKPQIKRWGRWSAGYEMGLGLSTWTSADEQSLYEMPLGLGAAIRYALPIDHPADIVAQFGMRSSVYWTSRSYTFSNISAFGRALDAGIGMETALWSESILLSAGLIFLAERRAENRTASLGGNLGVGFKL